MNPILWLFMIYLAHISLVSAQTAQECTNQCARNFTLPHDRPTPCCGCCSSASCHEIPEFTVCCQPNQAFCGCLSFRAFCSGTIYNSSAAQSAFGTCYNPSNPATATCSYAPDPNIWIVCPAGHSACPSHSFYSCCSPGTVCTTTELDSVPVCSSTATSCTQDYQCASLGTQYGFSSCQNGVCKCRSTFQGSSTTSNRCRCDSPSRVVYDNNGNPQCLSPGQCSVGGQELKYLCSPYSDNYNFVNCVNGHCQCLPGFSGNATVNNKCSCNNVHWLPQGPVCNG